MRKSEYRKTIISLETNGAQFRFLEMVRMLKITRPGKQAADFRASDWL